MNKSNIEWTEFTLNPIRGKCPHNCWYCYAWPIYQKLGYKEKEEPVFLSSVLEELKKRKKSSTIFIGSMFDLWANAIPGEWVNEIVNQCRLWRQHTYLFCTKNPARYHNYDFQKHCWYGAIEYSHAQKKNILILLNERLKNLNAVKKIHKRIQEGE